MIRIFQILSILLFLLVENSCEKEILPRFGFDSSFYPGSHGLTMMHVTNKSERIFLDGVLTVEEGAVQIKLLNHINDTVFNAFYESSVHECLGLNFPASSGDWKLNYISKNGAGYIDLHLHLQ